VTVLLDGFLYTISTINRECGNTYYHIYAETIIWKAPEEKSLGAIVHQDSDLSNSKRTHDYCVNNLELILKGEDEE